MSVPFQWHAEGTVFQQHAEMDRKEGGSAVQKRPHLGGKKKKRKYF